MGQKICKTRINTDIIECNTYTLAIDYKIRKTKAEDVICTNQENRQLQSITTEKPETRIPLTPRTEYH